MNLKISFLVTASLILMPVAVSGGEVRVGIGDIPEMALSGSPFARILDDDLSLAQAERDLAVRWSNPSLIWEMEEIGNETETGREWAIALEKEFAMPWSYAKKRSGSNLRLESSRRSWEASKWHLISHMRHGYVTLKLRDIEVELLEIFEEIIGDASEVIADRKEQGTVSGVEKRLIDMSLIAVRSRMVMAGLERREVMDEWKTAMGIPADDTVILVSELDLSADWLSSGRIAADGTSYVESRRLAVQSLEKGIGLEKGNILPSLSLAGGYKNVNDEADGFIFGISLPIPVLNRNSGGIDRARAEHRKAQVELDLFETARERQLSRLINAAEAESDLLTRYHDDFEQIEEHVRDLALSYKEGWIDLGDFLEGIRTYADGIESYFDMLEDYNNKVFELERLIERELYAPGSARKEETRS